MKIFCTIVLSEENPQHPYFFFALKLSTFFLKIIHRFVYFCHKFQFLLTIGNLLTLIKTAGDFHQREAATRESLVFTGRELSNKAEESEVKYKWSRLLLAGDRSSVLPVSAIYTATPALVFPTFTTWWSYVWILTSL